MVTRHPGRVIFGGTAIQTLIIIIVTAQCDWEKEVYTLQLKPYVV